MKTKYLRFISSFLVLSMIFMATNISVFAEDSETLTIDEQFIGFEETEKIEEIVSDYINTADEIINIEEYGVTYYMGDNFVIVEDIKYGYSVITYNEDKTTAYVNGNPIAISGTTEFDNDIDISKLPRSGDRVYLDSAMPQVSVAGLLVTVGIGVFPATVTTLTSVSSSITNLFSW